MTVSVKRYQAMEQTFFDDKQKAKEYVTSRYEEWHPDIICLFHRVDDTLQLKVHSALYIIEEEV